MYIFCRSLRLGTAVPKFWPVRLSLLIGISNLELLVLSLTNENEYTRESFRHGTVSPSYRLTNETEYMWSHSDLEPLVLLIAWLISLSTCVSHSDVEPLVLLIAWLIRQSTRVSHSDLEPLVLLIAWLMRLSLCVSHSDLEMLVLLIACLMTLITSVSHSDLEPLVLLIAWLTKQSRIYDSGRLIKLSASLTH